MFYCWLRCNLMPLPQESLKPHWEQSVHVGLQSMMVKSAKAANVTSMNPTLMSEAAMSAFWSWRWCCCCCCCRCCCCCCCMCARRSWRIFFAFSWQLRQLALPLSVDQEQVQEIISDSRPLAPRLNVLPRQNRQFLRPIEATLLESLLSIRLERDGRRWHVVVGAYPVHQQLEGEVDFLVGERKGHDDDDGEEQQ